MSDAILLPAPECRAHEPDGQWQLGFRVYRTYGYSRDGDGLYVTMRGRSTKRPLCKFRWCAATAPIQSSSKPGAGASWSASRAPTARATSTRFRSSST